MKISFMRGLLLGVVVLMLLAGCRTAAAPAITVESAWGRPSPTMPTAGGMYMMIVNTGDAADRLLSGSSPACGSIEVHEMVQKADGTMGMNLLDQPLAIAAGGQVELKPGDLHIMCIMKNEAFVPGATINLTLKFEKFGEVTIPVELRDE
jgi:periplasmic copper chaperone A